MTITFALGTSTPTSITVVEMDLENATQLADHLAVNVFPDYGVGLLHGKYISP